MTGDPNVPFNQITFRVTHPDVLDIPLEDQITVKNLRKVMDNVELYSVAHVLNSKMKFDFRVPEDMISEVVDEENPPNYNFCIGRWAAEAQIAGHNFLNPSFIKANLILFSEDIFAVMFLDLNDIAFYIHKIQLSEIKSLLI